MKELPNPTFPISQIGLPRGSLHQSHQDESSPGSTKISKSAIKVSWAKHLDEVRDAQRLRYQVFANEMGARLPVTMAGHDIDFGDAAASMWKQLAKTNLASIEFHVRPRLPLPIDELDADLPVEPPALIKGYLRLGAKILGAPAWDPDFNTADLPMMMQVKDLPLRYRKHFAGA
ncbi:MAG: hypothetical protein EB098_00145 [Betaproteobacteria bacterium]|nr:hypothetical protein [Betaproteobacteria bacterium]